MSLIPLFVYFRVDGPSDADYCNGNYDCSYFCGGNFSNDSCTIVETGALSRSVRAVTSMCDKTQR